MVRVEQARSDLSSIRPFDAIVGVKDANRLVATATGKQEVVIVENCKAASARYIEITALPANPYVLGLPVPAGVTTSDDCMQASITALADMALHMMRWPTFVSWQQDSFAGAPLYDLQTIGHQQFVNALVEGMVLLGKGRRVV